MGTVPVAIALAAGTVLVAVTMLVATMLVATMPVVATMLAMVVRVMLVGMELMPTQLMPLLLHLHPMVTLATLQSHQPIEWGRGGSHFVSNDISKLIQSL